MAKTPESFGCSICKRVKCFNNLVESYFILSNVHRANQLPVHFKEMLYTDPASLTECHGYYIKLVTFNACSIQQHLRLQNFNFSVCFFFSIILTIHRIEGK